MSKADLVFEPVPPQRKPNSHSDFRVETERVGLFEIGFVKNGVVTAFRSVLNDEANVRKRAHAVLDAYLDALGVPYTEIQMNIVETANRSN